MDINVIVEKYRLDNPRNLVFGQLRNWSELGFTSYKGFRGFTYSIDIGLPNVWKFLSEAKDGFIKIGKQAQEKIWEQLVLATKGFDVIYQSQATKYRLAIWRNMMKGNIAYANKRGWDNGRADYIQQINLQNEPIEFEPIACGGGTYLCEVLGQYTKVFAFDLKNNLPQFLESNYMDDFFGWQPCLISRDRMLSNGKIIEQIYPFPRTEVLGTSYFYVPVVAYGKNYHLVETRQMRFMKPTEVHPAYPLKNWPGMQNRSPLLERIVTRVE